METNPPNLSSPPPWPGRSGPPSIPSATARPERKSSRGLWPCALVLGLLALGAFFIFGLLAVIGKAVGSVSLNQSTLDFSPNIDERVITKGSHVKIAHIDLDGIIMNSSAGNTPTMVEELKQQLAKAIKDKDVAAIVLRINSPGGEVTASDLLHNAIQKANREKPVIAYMDSVAASGGYYAACGARKILAHPTTITGSIGVIIQSINYRELLGKVGVRMEVYKSGKFKDILSGSREPTEEERQYIQAMVLQTYERFLSVVSESRKKPVATLRDSNLADGRIYSGKDALASGMVDGNGFIDDAYKLAMKEANAEGATVVRYTPRHGFFDTLGLLESSAKAANPRLEIDVSDRLLPRLQPGVAYYLYLPASSTP